MGGCSLNLLYILIFTVLWTPALSNDKCSAGCKNSGGSPSFLNNHKYNYAVEGQVSIYLTGADKQETSVKLNGQASVAAIGNCAYVLRVQGMQITGPDGKKYKSPPGLEKPVRFTMQDGKVGSEICIEEGDTRRSLNIKRAVISLLQSPVKQSTETDVFGICPTQVSSSQEGGAVLLHRSRDLSRCGMREQGRNDLFNGVFDPNAEIKNTQILQSTLNVETKVKNGVPEKVSATEEYLYKPFSVGQNGARAKVHTKLTLTGQSGGTDQGAFTEVRAIIFENPHGVKLEQSNFQAASAAFKETLAALQNSAGSGTAGEFAQLVRVFRLTSKDDLQKLFGQAKGNKLGKRIFIDALLRAGTGASIELSVQLLKNKALDEIEQKVVYLSLGNAKHVTNDALKAASTLLDVPNIPKEVYLGVGALAGAYCQSHKCHGQGSQSQGIAALSQKFASKLHNCKSKNKIEEDYIVAALKGIRSIRHLEDTIIDRIAQCVTDKNVKARVKVAALDAFRADACTPKLKKVALDTMKNRQLDSEIRINAYLAVIECPCTKSASEIKNLLENEPVQQVGRFISSSLRHIRASANHDKAQARQHYGLIRTPNKFEVDDRKYSFYHEESFDIDSLGIGGSLEQSVIFSQDSFLPRSAHFNLTAQLFGHSLNVLEIGGRQGNLDRVIEHFLGPKSFLRSQSPQEVYDNLKKTFNDMSKTVDEKIRRKRDLKKDIDVFDKQVKDEIAPFDNELDLDLYVKLFGSEALFLSLGDDNGFNMDAIMKEAVKYFETGMNKAKNFQQDIRAHMLFLDAELAYPTSTGFALKLDLVGSAAGRFDISSKIDIRQIIKDPKNAKVDIKLVPSTDIEISGLFLVDADAVATGLKVITDFHTSTGGHLIAKLLDNSATKSHGIDIQLGLPVDKQEVIHVTSDLVFVTREKGQKENKVNLKIDMDKKDYAECFDQLSGVLGLTFCGELSVPFSVSGPDAQTSIQKFIARFPLTGPAKLKVRFEKNDLRGYHLRYLSHNNDGKQGFELLFDAEGGKDRKSSLTGELVNLKEEKSVLLSLKSPITTALGQISLIMNPTEYVGLVKAQLDTQEYYARVGFNVTNAGKRSVYKPVIEFQLPKQEKKAVEVDGEVVRESKGDAVKYTIDGLKIVMPNTNDIVNVQGYYLNDKKSAIELKAQKGEQNAALKSTFDGKDYTAEFTNTLNPHINFKVKGRSDNDFKQHHYNNDIEIWYGGDLKSDKNRVVIGQLLKFDTTGQQFVLVTKNKLSMPFFPLDIKANCDIGPKKVDVELEAKYDKHSGELELKARTDTKQPGDYNVKVQAEIMDKGIEIVANRDIVDSDKSNFENSISIKGVGKYELSGVVTHKMKPNDVNFGANGHLKFRTGKQEDDIKFDFGVIQNPTQHSSHLKLNTVSKSVVNYQFIVNRGPNTNGKLEMSLLDYFSTTGNFKMTENNGVGNGGFIMHFKKADKKFKGDVKFTAKDPVFDADVDLFLNYGKDDNDKFQFSTKNKYTQNKFNTVNKITYGPHTTDLKLSAAESKNGVESDFEVVLPNKRAVSYKISRKYRSAEGGVFQSEGSVVASYYEDKSKQPCKFTYKGKLDSNTESDFYNVEQFFELQLNDNKNWMNKFVFKNTPLGDKKFKGDFKNEMTGTLMPSPLIASGFLDYVDVDSIDGPRTYQLKCSFGDKISFNIDGKEVVALMGSGDKKYSEDITASMVLPFEKAHDIKWVSNILILVPENKDTWLDYSISETIKLNGEQYKLDGNGKISKNDGFTKIKLLVPHNDPFTLDTSYKNSEEGSKKSGEVEVKTTYGKGKSSNFHVKGVSLSNYEYSVNFKSNIPHAEKFKKLDVSLHTKNPTPDTYQANGIMDIDGNVYKSDSIVVFNSNNGLVDVKYNCPHKPPSRIYVKVDAAKPNNGKYEVKIENVQEFNFESNAEASLEGENIALSAAGSCDKLGWKNYVVKISSKESGGGKRLEFNVENDSKNVLSGSTSYISKQEGTKTIIEGSGSVKLQNQQKSATFKYIRTLLTEGNEQGIETFMNVAIGERSYVAEHRLTNLDHKMSVVYCEEKKQCANVDFHAKANVQDQAFQHTVNIAMDLRKLGISPEFGLQLKNELIQYQLSSTFSVHLAKDDKKYHLFLYNTPKHGSNLGYDTGIRMELPSRTLALESTFGAGRSSGLQVFPITGEVAAYVDKKTNKKLSATMNMDLIAAEKQHTFKANFKFHHPKLPQDAGVNIHSSFNHENYDNFKFEGEISATNEGKAKAYFDVKPNHMKLFLETPLVKVIDVEGSIIMKDNHQEGDFKFNLLEGKPVVMKAVVKDFKYYEFTTGYSQDAQRRLSIIGHIDTDKRVDISADIILNGAKKNIGHGALFIENDLFKTDYGASKENFDYFIKALVGDLEKLQERIGQISQKAQADVNKKFDTYKANYQKVKTDYDQELDKLKHELINDKTLQEFDKTFSAVFQHVARIVDDIVTATASIADNVYKSLEETWKQLNAMYDKEIKPQVQKMYASFEAIVKQYVDIVIDMLSYFAAIAKDFVDKHSPELKELSNIFADIYKSLSRILIERLKDFRMYATKVFNDIQQQVKEMPMLSMIKEKIAQFSLPDRLIEMVDQVNVALQSVLPTNEAKDLAAAIVNYLHKKIKNEKVNEEQELRIINQKLGAAFSSVVSFIKQQLQTLGLPAVFNLNFVPTFSTTSQTWPTFGGSSSFSILNEIMTGNIPNPLQYIKAYRPRSLNPLDEIPAKLRAVVVNGQHIFTFDGSHLTFPGNCYYVLAHDHVDRNFTLAIQLANGLPKAIALEDKDGAVVELKENGQVFVNGANHGFPAVIKDTVAYKETNGLISMFSKYGVHVRCTEKLGVCYFEVSGFYLGKLRGLLGDGNNEAFDDFRLPNGKIVTSQAEFGNAYKLQKSCPAVQTPEHSHHELHSATLPPACEEVFGRTSTLWPLALFLDVAPFRQACIHAVTANPDAAKKEACALAAGYTALAATGLLPAVMPTTCVQCNDANVEKRFGDVFNVNLPNKQADIVVLVETTKGNEQAYKDILVPVISQVVDKLKQQKLDDLKVYLVGITPKFPYPIIYDTENPKLKGAKVNFDDESRYKPIFTPIHFDNAQVDDIEAKIITAINDFAQIMGTTNVVAAYNRALELPLRAGAVKHTISLISEHCKKSFFLVEALRMVTVGTMFSNNAMTHSLITVTPDLKLANGASQNVIGYDATSVIMAGDKKRGLNTEQLRSQLTNPPDACVDFIEGTSGVVFSATNFAGQNPGQQKAFIQTAGQVIVDRMTRYNIQQSCACLYVDPFRVRSVCVKEDVSTRRRK